MPERQETVLVTGATGQQGGATARRLLADGWRVRALVRDPAAARARALAAAGAELVVGDMRDRASLDAAVAGAYGVFSVQPAGGPPHFDTDEERNGVNVAEAASAAGVEHLVYASVAGVERRTDLPHFVSKARIEARIRELGIPYTFLQPVQFMENHASKGPFGMLGEFPLIRMIPPGMTVQLIAVSDIGVFAGLAFADPEEYVGKALELAGDQPTASELATVIGRAVGREINVEPLPDEVLDRLGVPRDVVRNETSNFGDWQADIPDLRRRHPDLMDVGTWLEREGKALFEDLFAESRRSGGVQQV